MAFENVDIDYKENVFSAYNMRTLKILQRNSYPIMNENEISLSFLQVIKPNKKINFRVSSQSIFIFRIPDDSKGGDDFLIQQETREMGEMASVIKQHRTIRFGTNFQPDFVILFQV